MGGLFQNSGLTTTAHYMYNTVPDVDAQAFITAASITDGIQKIAINTLVADLKGYGIWTKSRALYPVVGGTSARHAINLRTPGTYNLTFTAGWVHSSTGMTPNGTSDYADTGLNAQTVVNTTNHLSYYSRTLTVGAQVEIGIWDSSVTTFNQIRPAANYYAGGLSNGGGGYTTTSDARGFWLGTKRSSSDREMYLNGVSQTTLTGTDSSNLPNGTLYLGARRVINSAGVDYYSSKQCAFASIGDGLTDAEALIFNNIVQNYQGILGRRV